MLNFAKMDKYIINILVLGSIIFILLLYFMQIIDKILIILILSVIGYIYYHIMVRQENFINGSLDIGPSVDYPFNKYISSPSNFINFNLTDKPRDSNDPNPVFWWWENYINKENAMKYANCNQYRCVTDKLNGMTALPNNKVANLEKVKYNSNCQFYENPKAYCLKNPKDTVCQNNWLY